MTKRAHCAAFTAYRCRAAVRGGRSGDRLRRGRWCCLGAHGLPGGDGTSGGGGLGGAGVGQLLETGKVGRSHEQGVDRQIEVAEPEAHRHAATGDRRRFREPGAGVKCGLPAVERRLAEDLTLEADGTIGSVVDQAHANGRRAVQRQAQPPGVLAV